MNTGEVIRSILIEKGEKITWLADKLNMSIQTLSTRLKKDLQFKFLLQICEILNITIDEIYKRYLQSN